MVVISLHACMARRQVHTCLRPLKASIPTRLGLQGSTRGVRRVGHLHAPSRLL